MLMRCCWSRKKAQLISLLALSSLISLQSLCLAPALFANEGKDKQEPPKEGKAPATTATPVERLAAENEAYLSLESLAKVLSLLENLYVDPNHVKPDEMIDAAIRGITSSLDPHTTYLPAKELKEFTNETTGKFGGIGVVILNSDARLEIVDVVEDSPGERAGLTKGDVIYSVGDLTVAESNIQEALSRLKGLPGSVVELGIVKKSDWQNYERSREEEKSSGKTVKPKITNMTIKRAVIRTPSVKHASLAPGFVYLNINVFQEETGEQTERALRKYEAANGGRIDGLILDLRGNPGGLLDQAVSVADLFIDSGIIVSTIGRNRETEEVEYATKRTTHPFMPIIVLVNEGTASASEIVAGALQDHERALVLGTKTFGKGSVQSIVPLPNGAGLKMTIARYYTPKGRSIQAKGIVPDIPVRASRWSGDAAAQASRREADLKGHIDATDLSNGQESTSFATDIEKWPEDYKEDAQLRIAYTYIRSWSRFERTHRPSLEAAPDSLLKKDSKGNSPLPQENKNAPIRKPSKSTKEGSLERDQMSDPENEIPLELHSEQRGLF